MSYGSRSNRYSPSPNPDFAVEGGIAVMLEADRQRIGAP